jgi:hypothetical protein
VPGLKVNLFTSVLISTIGRGMMFGIITSAFGGGMIPQGQLVRVDQLLLVEPSQVVIGYAEGQGIAHAVFKSVILAHPVVLLVIV